MSHRYQTAYGIDASGSQLVVVRAQGDKFEVVATAQQPKLDSVLKSRIDAEVAKGLTTTNAAMPCHDAVMRRIASPFTRLDRAIKVLPSLLDVQLPFPLEECSYVFTAEKSLGAAGLNVLAIAARRSDIQETLTRLSVSAGVDPLMLDHEGLTLWRQVANEITEAPPAGRVIVHLGSAHTTVVYGCGADLLGAHSVRQGSGERQRAALIARIQNWLAAQTYFVPSAATEWIFTGPGADDAATIAALVAQLSLTSYRVVDSPSLFLARGLARRALKETTYACNLRTGPLQHAEAARSESRIVRRASLLALYGAAFLIAINAAALFFSAKRNTDIQGEIQRQGMEIAGAPAPKGQETLVVRRALDEREAKMAPFQSMLVPATSKRVRDILMLCSTNGAAVSKIVLKPDAIRLEMNASHMAGMEAISRSLRESGWKAHTQKNGSSVLMEGTR